MFKLEKVQHWATKFILQDHLLGYKSRWMELNLLPISYWLEFQDIMFLIKYLQDPHDNFNIKDCITFASNFMRVASNQTLIYQYSRTSIGSYLYFNRIVRLWNHLPEVDLTESSKSLRFISQSSYGIIFSIISTLMFCARIT